MSRDSPKRVRARIRNTSPRRHDYRAGALWRGKPLGVSLQETCARRGGASALIEGPTTLSFTQLGAAVRRAGERLRGLGVQPGDAVAYQLPNWWEAAVTLLASVSIGAHAVPIVPFLRSREISRILFETHPRLIVAPEELGGSSALDLLEACVAAQPEGFPAPQIVLTRPTDPPGGRAMDFVELLASRAEDPGAEIEVDPDALAVIVYTSGSTAAPKGAMHTHETLDAELMSLQTVHDLGPADRVLMPSPLTHISGVIHGILGPALLGTSAVLMDRWEPGAALRQIEEQRVTYMIGAPTFLQEMLAHPQLENHDLSSLRLFSCGGASVSPELMRLGREKLPGLVTKRVYGSSEFPTISTTSAEDAVQRGLDTEGRALPGVELKICDEAGSAQPPGHEGEIRARGPDCFLGYVDPQLDESTFDGEGYLCTGDLGVLDTEGYLTVTGRAKDIVVRKGEKISARELEDLIGLHPDVAEVAIIPIADAETGERACACLRLEGDQRPLPLAALVEFLRGHDVPTRKLPEYVVPRSDFPRTPSGKIHKKRLREEVEPSLALRPAGR